MASLVNIKDCNYCIDEYFFHHIENIRDKEYDGIENCKPLFYCNEHERYLKILCTSKHEKYFRPCTGTYVKTL